ncbi:hypothetical protein [Hyphomicrobium sp.]|uniref:hypothetical protein n=1 Tax=Hyphomicrobium sp. TaxID=82 RepID=UPI0025BCEFA9|nr:hypothetical protein [Hyphomicrobium sp.]MCC7253928.1 hypothetical protein [Hyphomicrobium sp.]
MTLTLRTTALAALAAVAALAPLASGGDAHARGGKEFFSNTYQFDRPMNGYQGFSGAYHCSYIKTPKTVCNKAGQCKRIWELLQTCQ